MKKMQGKLLRSSYAQRARVNRAAQPMASKEEPRRRRAARAAGFPAPLNSEVTVGAAEATLPAVPCSVFGDCVMRRRPLSFMWSRAAPKTAQLLRRPTVGAGPLWPTRHAAFHLSMTANSLRWQPQGRKIGSYNRSSGEPASLDRLSGDLLPSTVRCDGSESDRRLQ
jgi:hypothetical protein